MADNKSRIAKENFDRYVYARDQGHIEYVEKADKCDKFYAADQWDPIVRQRLKLQGKPILTINKILATVGAVEGEQINNRMEAAFKVSDGGQEEIAHALTKVFKHIENRNDLHWREAAMAADGFITSRGFLDVRVEFDDSLTGWVKITNPNPRHIIIDPDAQDYDPDEWSEVFITRWLSPEQIALHYDERAAKRLKNKPNSDFLYGYDSIERPRQTFGGNQRGPNGSVGVEGEEIRRTIRVIERQFWKRRVVRRFVDPGTGDVNNVPENWDDQKVEEVAHRHGLFVIRQPGKQIRWTVSADDELLHDEWSPYNHFTVVPYFPFFRRGNTIGLVENLLSPQEQLNKVASQELHIVNTTANSGWVLRRGTLQNMTIEDLEQRGADTGLVLEVDGDIRTSVDKIQPNQVPTGLDRIGFKADNWIKDISGVGDSMRGFDREDVSARAIEAKQQRGAVNLAKPMDNLRYTKTLLARRVLSLVQRFYTEPRILRITGERAIDPVEEVEVNQPDESGEIVNDLSIGKYDVVTTMVMPRDVQDDQQFQEAVQLKELGVHVPDHWLVEFSHLENKEQIAQEMRQMAGLDSSEEAIEERQREAELELQKVQAELEAKQADSYLKTMRAEQMAAEIGQMSEEDKALSEAQNRQQEMELEVRKLEVEIELKREELEMKREIEERKMALEQAKMQQNERIQRDQIRMQVMQARSSQAR